MKRFITYFLAALFGSLVFAVIYITFENKNTSALTDTHEQLPAIQANYNQHSAVIGPDFVDAADKTVHAVVHIKSELQQRNINILGEASAIESFIQTDAVVNRGNSGGALVNTKGELVGINAAIASNTGSYAGYSFAIPVNIVKKVMDDFLNFGEIQRAYLGISFREIDSRFADEKGLAEVRGVYVIDVLNNGAASDAGINQRDVIVRVNNTDINSNSELLEIIGTRRPGDRIKVYAYRDNNLMEFDVILK